MSRRRRRIASLVAWPLWLAADAAAQTAAGEAPPTQGAEALIALAESMCAGADVAAPSADCVMAQRELARAVASALFKLGDSGERDAAVDVVRAFAGWPFADVRFAAAAALGGLYPHAEDTPVLARLLNDPVPAVRGAALAALRQSSDPAARRLTERAAYSQGDAMVPDGPLVDPAALPVPTPDGAEPVRFTEDADNGIAAFVTDVAPEDVLAGFAEAAGGEPIMLDALAALFGRDAAPPVDLSDPLAMMQYMQALQQRIDQLPEDQRQQAYLEAMQDLAAAGNPEASGDPVARWRDADLYGAPVAVVLPPDPAAPSPTPTRIAVVYRDLLLGRTGFALQWVEPAVMPPPPEPSTIEAAAEGEPAGSGLFGQPAPEERAHLSGDEVEALLWEAVQASADPAAAEAFANAFPDGPHADAAETLAETMPAPPDPEEPDSGRSSLFGPAPEPADATPDLAADATTVVANEPIVVRYAGLPAERRPWISIADAGSADSNYLEWRRPDPLDGGIIVFGHRPPGSYEVRAHVEGPQEVVARLAITVEPVDPVLALGPPTVVAEEASVAVGEPIVVRWYGLPGDRSDWITVVAVGTPETSWGNWAYTGGGQAGRLTLSGQGTPGDYEIRAYLEHPREVVARTAIAVTP